MGAGNQIMRRMKPADRGWSNLAGVGVGLDLLGARAGNHDIARSPLLQQKLRSLDDGRGVKARAHRAAMDASVIATRVIP